MPVVTNIFKCQLLIAMTNTYFQKQFLRLDFKIACQKYKYDLSFFCVSGRGPTLSFQINLACSFIEHRLKRSILTLPVSEDSIQPYSEAYFWWRQHSSLLSQSFQVCNIPTAIGIGHYTRKRSQNILNLVSQMLFI